MSEQLVEELFAAHGGLPRWRELTALRARARCGGFALVRGAGGGAFRRFEVMLSTREPWVVFAPFAGDYGSYRSGRASLDGDRRRERQRRTCAADVKALEVGGQAVWRYLCTPLLLAQPSAQVRELGGWSEGAERWRRLLLRLPSVLGGEERHVLYIDRRGLIRRHDCPLPGGRRPLAAHYCDRHRSFGGIVLPTRRRGYLLLPGGQAMRFPLLLWMNIDLVEPLAETSDCA
jgi:hypothetical protein